MQPEMPTKTKILTCRETQVIHLLIAGYTQGAIAYMLNVQHDTIWRHRGNACRKLGATSTPMLIAAALVRGCVSPEEAAAIISSSPNKHPFAPDQA